MATYKKVKVPGGTVRVATKLAPATNARKGYCGTCSGNGTVPNGKKVKPCGPCNGTGRAGS